MFVVETRYVFCEVGIECLNITQISVCKELKFLYQFVELRSGHETA